MKALIHANMASEQHNEFYKAIKISTYGVLFFGTPHQGSSTASWASIVVNVSSVYYYTNSSVLKNLERDSEWLEIQLEQYKAISNDFLTKFMYETLPISSSAGTFLVISDSRAY
jgi:hypothetical protein